MITNGVLLNTLIINIYVKQHFTFIKNVLHFNKKLNFIKFFLNLFSLYCCKILFICYA